MMYICVYSLFVQMVIYVVTILLAIIVVLVILALRRNSKEHERRLTTMISNLPGFIYRCRYDKEWTMKYISDRCIDITGHYPDEFLNNRIVSYNDVILEEHRDEIYAMWDRVVNEKSYFEHNYRITTKSGEVKWVYERGLPIFGKSGAVEFLEGYIEDITALRMATNTLSQKMNDLEQEIEKRIETERVLLKAKQKAEESDRLKMAFLANMSHEIRTPMNGILGFIDLLQDPDINDGNRSEYLDLVKTSGHRLLTTINDIIEISKIESGEIVLRPEKVNTEDIMNFYYDFFVVQTRQKGLELIMTDYLRGEESDISTDRNKLDSILTNLIRNSIKFTSKGSIELGNYRSGGKITFFIKDTGRGLPKEKIEDVFKRFVQAETNINRSYEGSGIGLSIVKAYVEAQDGEVWVDSEPGKGSTFYFSLPVNQEAVAM